MKKKFIRKLLCTPFSKKILLGYAEDCGSFTYQNPEKCQDVTDEAVRAVFEWFVANYEDSEIVLNHNGFEVTFQNSPYVLRMTKKRRYER